MNVMLFYAYKKVVRLGINIEVVLVSNTLRPSPPTRVSWFVIGRFLCSKLLPNWRKTKECIVRIGIYYHFSTLSLSVFCWKMLFYSFRKYTILFYYFKFYTLIWGQIYFFDVMKRKKKKAGNLYPYRLPFFRYVRNNKPVAESL